MWDAACPISTRGGGGVETGPACSRARSVHRLKSSASTPVSYRERAQSLAAATANTAVPANAEAGQERCNLHACEPRVELRGDDQLAHDRWGAAAHLREGRGVSD